MTRRPLPPLDGEHSSAWWRAIAIAHLQQHRAITTTRIAAQIRHRRQMAAHDATCESETQPADDPAGGTKP